MKDGIRVGDRVFYFDNKMPFPNEGLGTVLEVLQESGTVILLSDNSGAIITQMISDCMKMDFWKTDEKDFR